MTETSDDPITLAILAIGGAGVFAASGGFSGGGGDDKVVSIPTKKAENVKRTAEPIEQVSEAGRKRRLKRRQASLLTRDFGEPQLGIPELTGQERRLG